MPFYVCVLVVGWWTCGGGASLGSRLAVKLQYCKQILEVGQTTVL